MRRRPGYYLIVELAEHSQILHEVAKQAVATPFVGQEDVLLALLKNISKLSAEVIQGIHETGEFSDGS